MRKAKPPIWLPSSPDEGNRFARPWNPNDEFIWDAWYAWEGDWLPAFYLQADRHECNHDSEARHNLASVGHAVRKRLFRRPPRETDGLRDRDITVLAAP